ncbi:MAG: hypothetical protein GF418_11800 [Chitinivibrionales bacterium]|nr:hypothetical protein [Chitinivibrionales bacterium]MBD3396300.1 hypothetical protein [Chitinivibrionales bacterium]
MEKNDLRRIAGPFMSILSRRSFFRATAARRLCAFRALPSILMLVGIAWSNEPVTITAHAGAKQTFEGLGCSHVDNDPPLAYLELPTESRLEMIELLWKEARFHYLRVWLEVDESLESFNTRLSRYLTDMWAVNPDARLLFSPHGPVGNPRGYAGHFAEQMYLLRRDYGIPMYATGIGNEPNNPDIGMSREMVPLIVKTLRDSLDYWEQHHIDSTGEHLGLDTVRIIAPEVSNTADSWYYDFVEAIQQDPEAIEALDAFAVHSYNMCMTKDALDMVAEYLPGDGTGTHALWETESSNTLQPEIPSDKFNGDSLKGSETVARMISDVNLGVSVWLFWKGIQGFTVYDNGSNVIGHNHISGEYRPFLKYYYLRQIARTFDIGTVMRRCTSDLSADDNRYVYMENWYCNPDDPNETKSPVCAAVGQNPDGEWAIAVVNQTGIPNRPGANFKPATTYDVTIQIEELAGSGSQQYLVFRCNNGTRNVIDDNPATMVDGAVTVTIGPNDLVSLRPHFDTTYETEPRDFVLRSPECGGCGSGVVAAFLPPLGFKAGSLARRRKRRARKCRDTRGKAA